MPEPRRSPTPGDPGGTAPPTPVEALQQTLAAEHAAVFVLADLGGRVSASADPEAAGLIRDAYVAHRGRRDLLRTEVTALGEQPAPPAAAYAVPDGSRDGARLLAVAATAEQRCAAHYARLVSASAGERRGWAVEALIDSAVRLLALGGAPSRYPGLPDLDG